MTKPAGNALTMLAFWARLGPRLRAVSVKVTDWPEIAGAGAADLLRARSAPGMIGVVTSASLLFGSGSGVPMFSTTAALVMLPLPALTRARNVNVALPFTASVPAWVAVIVPALKVQPVPLKLFATYVVAAGRVSTTRKLVDGLGPSLMTVRVYVTSPPPTTGFGEAVFCRRRSPATVSVVAWLRMLLAVLVSPLKNGSAAVRLAIGVLAGGVLAPKPTAPRMVTVPGAWPPV